MVTPLVGLSSTGTHTGGRMVLGCTTIWYASWDGQRSMPRAQSGAALPEDGAVLRLLGVLLVDALRTIALGRRAPAARETREWVCAGPGGPTYSFDDACAAFGLPAQPLRRRLGLRLQSGRRRTTRGWRRGPSR